MYCWGKFTKTIFDPKKIEELYSEANSKIADLEKIPIEEILTILDQVGGEWSPKSKNVHLAQKFLEKELSFSPSMIAHSLSLIPFILDKENLRKRLNSELLNINQLDSFVQSSQFNGKIRAKPLGVLTHYTAGNVFLGFLDSLVMGLITKNINIIKLSSGNHFFPELFLKILNSVDKKKQLSSKIAVIYWRGGDISIEKVVKRKSHGLMAWGGEEMVKSLNENLPTGTKLIDYGPKISFSVISSKAFKNYPLSEIAKKISYDLILWDQAACASPQNLFIQNGIDEKVLMKEVSKVLLKTSLKRGQLSKNEEVEIQKEIFKSKTDHFLKQGSYITGKDFLLHFEKFDGLRNSPLNRTLIIKKFNNLDNLQRILSPNKPYLQSCSLLVTADEEKEYCEKLSNAGVKRFSELGTILYGKTGAPHDGRLTLNELLRFIPIENNKDLLKIAQDSYEKNEFYKKKFKTLPKDFLKLPLLDSSELTKFTPDHNKFVDGHIFSSGGTSGAPKYSYYSREEFNHAVKMIAQGLRVQGIQEGCKVANLFVAGNLWSSFIAIEKALEELKTIQLSIGGLAEKELMVSYLEKFKPDVLIGLPTLLLDLAESCKKNKIRLKIKQIYYAGEKMPAYAVDVFKKIFSCEQIFSAGYASVDAGPIGYQCPHSKAGEHHLFDDFVHLEIIKHEAVITTKYRETMPAIRLKTGDRVDIIHGKCPCGSSSTKFILQGRIDNLLHIWGCRIPLDDIEKALGKIIGKGFQYQILLRTEKRIEKMLIYLETKTIPDKAKASLWSSLADLKNTHPFSYFDSRCELIPVTKVERIARTGKIKKIKDERD